MVPTIYLETSIISYLAAQPSRDLITAARQQLTHEWWVRRRGSFQGLDYLMTWNATHIANALIRPRVERVCRGLGFEPPVLCTPDELMAGEEP